MTEYGLILDILNIMINEKEEYNILRYFREYQQRGHLFDWETLTCGLPEHGILYTGLDSEFKFYLYCLECNYKMFPGAQMIEDVINAVETEINRNAMYEYY
jgi:hypothetical protein